MPLLLLSTHLFIVLTSFQVKESDYIINKQFLEVKIMKIAILLNC